MYVEYRGDKYKRGKCRDLENKGEKVKKYVILSKIRKIYISRKYHLFCDATSARWMKRYGPVKA